MNIPAVEVPKDKAKIQRQITALEWQLTQDTNDIDREIHLQALKSLKESDKADEYIKCISSTKII
jgi:hypothetical protein